MGSFSRRAFGDAIISVGALIILLVLLVSVDDRVRERVSGGVFGGAPSSSELVGAGKEVTGLVTIVVEAVKDQSVEHAPLAIFTVAAIVLVLFMVRT